MHHAIEDRRMFTRQFITRKIFILVSLHHVLVARRLQEVVLIVTFDLLKMGIHICVCCYSFVIYIFCKVILLLCYFTLVALHVMDITKDVLKY